MPISSLPIVKSRAVTAPPNQTTRQAIRTSGRILKAAPKRNVSTANEIMPLTLCMSSSCPGTSSPLHRARAASAALTAKETSKRKAITSIIANETTLPQISRINVLRVFSDLICTTPNAVERGRELREYASSAEDERTDADDRRRPAPSFGG